MQRKSVKHERINDILLGPVERPAVQFLARHMPGWVTPDILTSVGFIGALIVCASYILTRVDASFLWLASFGYLVNWFGDSLDGSLARYRKIERPKFGYFIDHTVDAFTQVMIGVGIGLSPYVNMTVALYALIGYLLVSIHTYITVFVRGFFKISYGCLGPTEARVLAILVNTAIFFGGNPTLNFGFLSTSVFDIFFFLIGTLLIVIYIIATLKQADRLATIDRTGA